MALRSSRRLLLGQYSRMLDMGGAPSAATKNKEATLRAADGAKNSKLQAVAFDFHLLTSDVEKAREQQPQEQQQVKTPPSSSSSIFSFQKEDVTPNVDLVQNIANLLNVDLGGISTRKKKNTDYDDDDLSALIGGSKKEETTSTTTTSKESSSSSPLEPQSNTAADSNYTSNDVRAKYAAKLRRKVDGGMAGYERAKQEHEDTMKRGDAAGHLVARAIATQQSASKSKWLATTGTGSLLSFVTTRSMKIALLPIPQNDNPEKEAFHMEEFQKQLSNQVHFDVLVKEGNHAKPILKHVADTVGVPDGMTMVVSNRDDYLKEAKDRGMITCRIQPLNARRGNVTAHYNVKSVADVQEVVNEINGISFNAVFKMG
mmetsp:Transcript_5142/g.7823  ORF Transcript_5142/g.7823 Transcript_5142/m.7823 type:complete len:372 (+) Transcript_5142:144-1259(+)|eukprot:CAMPEP_0195290460 /NCGR_PEP_ID=MMETSP0707-20130614/6317_1 /TAXON_ID=33640 /ORGANISM="Asterionellopsis glacialis, Strain CCMP134" /LENGTH=371 /DNA_ID=CAMNT_0040350591 /DNA_START=67 /DNA_END=1182 /DNA_ORIENTATION=-